MLRTVARVAKLGAKAAPRVAVVPKASFSNVMSNDIDAISGLTESQQEVRPYFKHVSHMSDPKSHHVTPATSHHSARLVSK